MSKKNKNFHKIQIWISFFLQTTGQGRGDMTGVLHIHHAALGDRLNIQPSRQDYQVAENSIRNRDLPFFIWGVVTKSRDELGMRIFLSKPDRNGNIVHDEIPVLYEYDLDHVLPIAA